jgi:hypothetical protein
VKFQVNHKIDDMQNNSKHIYNNYSGNNNNVFEGIKNFETSTFGLNNHNYCNSNFKTTNQQQLNTNRNIEDTYNNNKKNNNNCNSTVQIRSTITTCNLMGNLCVYIHDDCLN